MSLKKNKTWIHNNDKLCCLFCLTLAKKDVSSSSGKSTMSSSMKLAGVKLRLWARLRVLSLNERPWKTHTHKHICIHSGNLSITIGDIQIHYKIKYKCRRILHFSISPVGGFCPSSSPWRALLRPWSSSLPQTPSSVGEAVGWDLSGSWWKSKARRLRGWWGSEARCSHPPPPPFERLVLVPTGPQSGDQWVNKWWLERAKQYEEAMFDLRHFTYAITDRINTRDGLRRLSKSTWLSPIWMIYFHYINMDSTETAISKATHVLLYLLHAMLWGGDIEWRWGLSAG